MRRKIVILLLLFFSLAFNVPETYAWNTELVGKQEIVSIGTWEFISQWSSAVRYNTGDKVIYNGVEYIALRNVPAGKIPGANGSKNFWRVN